MMNDEFYKKRIINYLWNLDSMYNSSFKNKGIPHFEIPIPHSNYLCSNSIIKGIIVLSLKVSNFKSFSLKP